VVDFDARAQSDIQQALACATAGLDDLSVSSGARNECDFESLGRFFRVHGSSLLNGQ
jgi:hypothetical protein